jgi:hypothetical protein
MSLSQPRILYGVHSISPYNRATGEPYGIAKVIGQFSANFSGELQELTGGSSKFPWAVEESTISAELSLSFKEYASWMFELFLGATPSDSGVDATGTISSLTNKKGTSVSSGTTGVASVTVIPTTGAENLKFTKYLLKAVSSTAVDVYGLSDADFTRGTDAEFSTDTLKIATSQTIVSTDTTDIASFGLRLTGGSGTIGMTTGDTAVFEVKPPSTKSMEVVVGASGQSFPEFGCIAMAQKRGTGELFELDVYRCKGAGLPIGLKENAFSEAEVSARALYDSERNGVYKARYIQTA